jgi:hypothetical protein
MLAVAGSTEAGVAWVLGAAGHRWPGMEGHRSTSKWPQKTRVDPLPFSGRKRDKCRRHREWENYCFCGNGPGPDGGIRTILNVTPECVSHVSTWP